MAVQSLLWSVHFRPRIASPSISRYTGSFASFRNYLPLDLFGVAPVVRRQLSSTAESSAAGGFKWLGEKGETVALGKVRSTNSSYKARGGPDEAERKFV